MINYKENRKSFNARFRILEIKRSKDLAILLEKHFYLTNSLDNNIPAILLFHGLKKIFPKLTYSCLKLALESFGAIHFSKVDSSKVQMNKRIVTYHCIKCKTELLNEILIEKEFLNKSLSGKKVINKNVIKKGKLSSSKTDYSDDFRILTFKCVLMISGLYFIFTYIFK